MWAREMLLSISERAQPVLTGLSSVTLADLWGYQDIYFHFTSCQNKYNKISVQGGGEKVCDRNYTKAPNAPNKQRKGKEMNF